MADATLALAGNVDRMASLRSASAAAAEYTRERQAGRMVEVLAGATAATGMRN